jgi:mono/diheme cytochrome c family protein
MKIMRAIAIAGLMLLCAGVTFGEVTIREVTLEWEDVANLEGDELFNNLCAVCHGTGGDGDGPAVGALEKGVPDLTSLAANNDGVYSHRNVENVIYGKHRVVAHGAIDMPIWGEQFMYVRPGPGVNSFPHKYFARERVHTLSNYIESIQIH